jgi:hypothetical protein
VCPSAVCLLPLGAADQGEEQVLCADLTRALDKALIRPFACHNWQGHRMPVALSYEEVVWHAGLGDHG